MGFYLLLGRELGSFATVHTGSRPDAFIPQTHRRKEPREDFQKSEEFKGTLASNACCLSTGRLDLAAIHIGARGGKTQEDECGENLALKTGQGG